MKQIKDSIIKFMNLMSNYHVNMYAASSAFYLFICIIPILIIVVSLIPYTTIEEITLIEFADNFLPDYSFVLIKSIIEEVYNQSNSILPISLIVMAWTASKAMVSIRLGLNEIANIKERSNFLISRLIGTIYTILSMLLIIVISFISVFGQRLHNYIASKNIIKLLKVLSVLVENDAFITILGFFIVFVMLFSFLPAKIMKIKTVIPGAFFASLTGFLFSKIFNILVNNYFNFTMYGSLATIIVILLYFYFFFYFFFLGAIINQYFLSCD